LAGGSTMFPGLASRIETELTPLLPPSIKPKVYASNDRKYAVWIGGSIWASMASTSWLTKEMYDQYGPTCIHRVFPDNGYPENWTDAEFSANGIQAQKTAKEKLLAVMAIETKKSSGEIAKTKPMSNTNCGLLRLGLCIPQQQEQTTEEPTACSKCKAVLNCFSEVKTAEDGTHLWTCEFCQNDNKLQPGFFKPKSTSVTYSEFLSLNALKKKNAPMVIFCIDTSSSMRIIKELKEGVEVDKRAIDQSTDADWVEAVNYNTFWYNPASNESAWEPPPGSTGWLKWSQPITYYRNIHTNEILTQRPSTKHSSKQIQQVELLKQDKTGKSSFVTFELSRLQCVQTAVHAQMEALKKSQPETIVALIGFDDSVTVFGDGQDDPLAITDDTLRNYEELLRLGKEEKPKMCSVPLYQSLDMLVEKLYDMHPRGVTALGPALTVAVGMASESPGSKIIICTDGVANVGVGNISANDVQFYTKIANLARSKGVAISVISMEGENCSVEHLGTAADISGGSVEIVDPLQLGSKVSAMLSKQVIATNLSGEILLSPHLKFTETEQTEENNNANSNNTESSTKNLVLGSVTDETDIGFMFDWRQSFRQEFEKKYETLDFDASKTLADVLPSGKIVFQAQLDYLDASGQKTKKVITCEAPVKHLREEVEKDINSTVIAVCAIQHAAKLAQLGNYDEARIHLVSTQRLLQRGMKTTRHQKDYMSYIVQAEKLDQFMREAQQYEAMVKSDRKSLTASAEIRKAERDDDASKSIFQMKALNVKTFNERL